MENAREQAFVFGAEVQRELLFWNCSRRQFPRASRRAANVRGMHNNVPRGRRVNRPWAHPRRRRSPVSREPNGRPLVKVLLFASLRRATRAPRETPQCFIKFSGALRGVRASKQQGRRRLPRSVSFYKRNCVCPLDLNQYYFIGQMYEIRMSLMIRKQ